jgi:hypothetical protein
MRKAYCFIGVLVLISIVSISIQMAYGQDSSCPDPIINPLDDFDGALAQWELLFEENFENFDPKPWQFNQDWWKTVTDNDEIHNTVMEGKGHNHLYYQGRRFSDASYQFDVKFIDYSYMHFVINETCQGRYFIGISPNGLYIAKSYFPDTHITLASIDVPISKDTWNKVKVMHVNGLISIEIEGVPLLDYLDEDNPFFHGFFNFESLIPLDKDGNELPGAVRVDNIEVNGLPCIGYPVINCLYDMYLITSDPDGMEVKYPSLEHRVESGLEFVANWQYDPPSGSFLSVGDTDVVCTLTDTRGNVTYYTFNVHVKFSTNQKPVAIAIYDPVIEADSPLGASSVILNGSPSYDPDGDPLYHFWFVNNNYVANAPIVDVTLSMGKSDISFIVSDGISAASKDFVIDVVDTTPPKIKGIVVDSPILWPPNHKMVSITVDVTASDVCDPKPSSRIINVMSNDPTTGLDDIEITGDLSVNLRAERSGKQDDRVYILLIESSDHTASPSNVSFASATVTVPHDQGNNNGKKKK